MAKLSQKYTIERKYVTNPKARPRLPIAKVRFLVAHETANNTADADAHYRYFNNIKFSASAHTFIDDGKILEIIPINEKAWHVNYDKPKDNEMYGDDANDAAIGTELCRTGNFARAYDKYVWYHAYLCRKFGLDPVRHIVSHKVLDPQRRSDPQSWLSPNGVTWIQFVADVKRYYDEWDNDGGGTVKPPKPETKPEEITKPKWSEVTGNWTGQTLRRGHYGKAVRQLQTMLSNNNPPFYPNKGSKNNGIDNYYGDDTTDAVRRFQSYYGLQLDGLAGKEVYSHLSGKKPSKPKPSKSISQMAQEVIDGKHGNGHANRRKSLGISQNDYNKVRAEVNRIASGSSRKSISQMAKEVIDGKHGNGHESRRKSLGISQSEYEKVRKEVNKKL